MTRNIRPPGTRSGVKQRERWEEQVSSRLDNTDFSLDDITRILFLGNRTTSGQQSELDAGQERAYVYRQFVSKISEIDRQLDEARRRESRLSGEVSELKRKIRELEVLAHGC
jgi:hypothetical protein